MAKKNTQSSRKKLI